MRPTAGVIHRDLKPDNIMLTVRAGEPNVVKVCDFGIAHASEGGKPQLAMQGSVLGTPPYMSPEQFTGRTLDARSDVYALGMVVYEMLAGVLPFRGTTPLEWAQKHINDVPAQLTTHGPAAHVEPFRAEVVMRALEKDPAHRPESALEFARVFSGAERMPTGWGLSTVGGIGAASPGGSIAPPASSFPPPSTSARANGGDGWPDDMALPTKSSVKLGIGGAVALLALIAGGVFASWMGSSELNTESGDVGALAGAGAADAGRPPRDTGVDAAEARPVIPVIDPPPSDWLRIVHFEEEVDESAAAIGPPDGVFAVLRPRGRITLELVPGLLIRSDRSPGPDLHIQVDDAHSGPYSVEVGEGHHELRTIAHALSGSLPLDLDQYRTRSARYVRITNLSSRLVYLDAVGVYGTTEVEHHH